MEKFKNKWIIRNKPLTKLEYAEGFSLGRKIEVPDTKYCTRPIYVKGVKDGIVYFNWLNYADTVSKTDILSPEYIDENWVVVDKEFYKLPASPEPNAES